MTHVTIGGHEYHAPVIVGLSADSIAALMQPAPRADAFSVTLDRGMKVREGGWDGQRSREELRRYAERADGTIDWAKAAKGYTVFDLNPEGRDPVQADGKLNVAYVEDGALVAVGNGIRNALSRLPQVEPPLADDVASEAEAALRGLLDKLNEQTADALAKSLSLDLDFVRGAVQRASDEIIGRLAAGDDAQTADVETMVRDQAAQADRGDGSVWRMSRVALELDDAQRSVLDRAIAVADRLAVKNDAVELKTIADELRADGLDDYIQDGFLMLPVLAARTGTQTYSDGRSTWGEFRPDAEVEASLASYGLKPFTDDHPPGMVTSNDYGALVKGACGQDAVLLERAADGNRYVKLTILVGDAATIRKIRDGKVELSAGYTTVPVHKPGLDAAGNAYEYEQTQIKINHLALVDRGRAGPLARISVDGAAWEVQTPTTDAQERDDVKTKDQLDPEVARMLLMAAMAYMMPESPETATAALEKLAMMSGLEAEELAVMLKHEMPASEPEPDMEMVEMDGIKAKMTAADAAAYRARAKANLDGETTLKNDLAAATAALKVMERKVDKLQSAQDRVEFDALYEEIRGVCPQLVEAWDGQKKSNAFTLDAAQMREKATLDLDPDAKDELDEARGTDTFDATLKGAFRAAMRAARRRKANSDSGDTSKGTNDNDTSNLVSVLDRLNNNHKKFVGAK